MNAVQTLPENYRRCAGLNMKNLGLQLKMNIAGFFLLVLFGWLFTAAAVYLRPDEAATFLLLKWEGVSGILTIVIVLALMFFTIVVHEAIHGLGFILLAKAHPIFAFRGVYAYAAAPEWFIPRDPYLMIGLAPFMVISLVGLALMAIVPAVWIAPLVLMCVVNASGAVGDLWVAVLLLRQPPEALSNDTGDEINIYAPGHNLVNHDIY
ncbi:MAG: DUF3267 domain-containing protein [Bellilinea sp.]